MLFIFNSYTTVKLLMSRYDTDSYVRYMITGYYAINEYVRLQSTKNIISDLNLSQKPR